MSNSMKRRFEISGHSMVVTQEWIEDHAAAEPLKADVLAWLTDNEISYRIRTEFRRERLFPGVESCRAYCVYLFITFHSPRDATVFKLRWL
jgi:hypothetical protein